jgi:hypothetical protein
MNSETQNQPHAPGDLKFPEMVMSQPHKCVQIIDFLNYILNRHRLGPFNSHFLIFI